MRAVATATALITAAVGAAAAHGQVTFERLLNAGAEPHNWLTYSGTYASQRHTALTQIRPSNVGDLELKWVYPGAVAREASRRRRWSSTASCT